jgi:hypothetical protein
MGAHEMLAMVMLMPMLTLSMVQTVPGPPDDEAVTRPVTAQRGCAGDSDEILVCARAPDADRLIALPEPTPRQIFKPAAVQISPNARAGLRAGASSNPMITTPRAMVDLTIKF